MKLTISACCIVKNESCNLPRWLKCMKQVADEIIVVDTGSSDNTVDIARAAGAKVYYFQWVDDFSAAKNFAIDKAKGQWIFFLDADEWFSDGCIDQVRGIIAKYHCNKKIASIISPQINIDSDNNNELTSTLLQMRIFRNLPSIRYAGRIHEQVQCHKPGLQTVRCDAIRIMHTGYAASRKKSKAERNLALLLLAEQEALAGDQDMTAIYSGLMDAYNMLGQSSKAIEYAGRLMSAENCMLGMDGHAYDVIVSSLRQQNKPSAEILQVYDEAISMFPAKADFYLEKAFVLYDCCRYNEALAFLAEGLAKEAAFARELQQGKRQLEDNTAVRLLPRAYCTLGNILCLKGDLATAKEAYLEGLRQFKYDRALLQGLYGCLKDMDDMDDVAVIQQLNVFYDRGEDSEFLLSALMDIASGKVLAYYGKNAPEKYLSGIYLKLGRYEAAISRLSDTADWASQYLRNNVEANTGQG